MLDDRIRAVCAKIEAAPDGDFGTLLQELLKLVHEKKKIEEPSREAIAKGRTPRS